MRTSGELYGQRERNVVLGHLIYGSAGRVEDVRIMMSGTSATDGMEDT